MFETFTLGGLAIPSIYMAILLSLVVTYLMLWDSEEKRTLFSRWVNALIILFLIYKITYLFFNWNAFTDNPFGVFYYDGGAQGLLIALMAAFLYLFYQSKGLFYVEAYCIFAVSFLTFQGILEFRTLMQWHYIALAIITLAVLVSIYFIWRRFRVIFILSITIFLMHLIARFFIYSGPEFVGISIIQWWIILSLVYSVLTTVKDAESE
ncbi:hypothetical protein ACFOLA_08060 [Salinicoccus hispanicus]|uniref:Uncharacterized protein n=1 Tax=Salinicoccus hispanicus TaxID=157225 RepID=A0A6N8U7S8_9STAP|nr:hypothetical protein [Salinicoccus hispanicus]MXQ51709.1 hypothetical protein [Salinicoccus hispanicus]